MRPIRLVAHGLTAYHHAVEIDFTELDLFAVTGPTGAGKSSLVDAITYALFGQVPRVGRNVKELISQGEDRLKVSLEFSANGERYRIHRSTARKGQAPVQLERFDEGEGDWTGITERAAEATSEIVGILRMDYDAFIRSVLLPQGDFAQFLAGDRDERRKVLDGLLQIGVFAVMAQKANTLAARHSDEANRIRERLDTELVDATSDKLREAKADLEAQRQAVVEAVATRQATEKASETATKLAETREREAKAREALAEAERKLAEAQEAAATGKQQEAAHKAAIEALQKRVAANKYDEPAYLRYQRAAGIAQDLANEERAAADGEKQLAALAKEADAASAAAEKAAKACETATKQAERAQHEYVEARMTNAAAVLQRELKPGDDCPVCGGKVGKVTVGPVAKLDEVKTAADKAKEAEAVARKAMDAANSKRDQAAARVEAHEKSIAVGAQRIAERTTALTEALAGEALEAGEIAARLEAMESAREERDGLRAELERETAALNAVVSRTVEAAGSLARWQADVERCGKDATEAGAQIATLGAGLRETSSEAGWDDVVRALESGTDAASLVRRRLEAARQNEQASEITAVRIEERIKQIEKDIKLAKELTKKEQEARETATLARDLASLLRTDAFPTFIRERALQTLALEGSRRLEEISGGRYDLVVDKQDFEIEDRWNGSERRSVKTLSGGETFLASLALALALAEHLPGLGSGGASGTLESLFIDEGFSHLDNETLDTVAGALEVLGQDRRRLIGVITHVQVLADRMPARITVHKSQAGSTVSVE